MNLLGNIIWLLCGGLMTAFEYLVSGVFMCFTIVGIPFGLQVFKLGVLALFPFGQKSVQAKRSDGCLYIVMNVIWFFIGGVWIALTHLAWGILLFITIIGIPFAKQHFKLMSTALSPFGRDIISD